MFFGHSLSDLTSKQATGDFSSKGDQKRFCILRSFPVIGSNYTSDKPHRGFNKGETWLHQSSTVNKLNTRELEDSIHVMPGSTKDLDGLLKGPNEHWTRARTFV